MTYWNEKRDSHVPIWNHERYQSYWKIRHEINEDGYRCDPLQPTDALFLGVCDVMTNLENGDERWSKIVHDRLWKDQPYIALGTVASGLPTMIRRLHSFIEQHGAPSFLYMTVPRFDGYEHVDRSGQCYNVSTRALTPRYSTETGLVSDEDGKLWMEQIEFNKRFRHAEEIRYIVEERFAFLELMCKFHEIDLAWTFNPSDAGIVTLHENIEIFRDLSDFMKDSFVGLVQVKDHMFDRSIGPLTHSEIANLFLKQKNDWDFELLKKTAELNFDWLSQKHPDELIKDK